MHTLTIAHILENAQLPQRLPRVCVCVCVYVHMLKQAWLMLVRPTRTQLISSKSITCEFAGSKSHTKKHKTMDGGKQKRKRDGKKNPLNQKRTHTLTQRGTHTKHTNSCKTKKGRRKGRKGFEPLCWWKLRTLSHIEKREEGLILAATVHTHTHKQTELLQRVKRERTNAKSIRQQCWGVCGEFGCMDGYAQMRALVLAYNALFLRRSSTAHCLTRARETMCARTHMHTYTQKTRNHLLLSLSHYMTKASNTACNTTCKSRSREKIKNNPLKAEDIERRSRRTAEPAHAKKENWQCRKWSLNRCNGKEKNWIVIL